MAQKQCSDIFEQVFDARIGSNCRTCVCGRTYFNSHDIGCFDGDELEELEKKTLDDPDMYIAVDYTIGTMDIGGVDIVIGCSCDTAAKYERFILTHAKRLKEYLRLQAIALRKKADEIDSK